MNALVKTAGKTAPAHQTASELTQYLTFMLSGETYAIGILVIKEIIEFCGVTTVPLMPDCVRGVINLRGAVVPVIDLAARFGKPANEVTKRTCIVIVEIAHESGQQVVGVMVDAVNAVLDIAASDIEPAPAFGARMRSDFIAGMGKVNGKFVIVLAIENVLSTLEISAMVAGSEVSTADMTEGD